MIPIIDTDVETYSKEKLPKVGAWAYSLHESTGVWCLCFWHEKMNRDSFSVWVPGDPVPEIYRGPYILAAHNFQFERAIFLNILCPKYGFAEPFEYRCTMAAAMRFNLPASLDGVSAALNLDEKKDKHGSKLMVSMSNRATYDPSKPKPKNLNEEKHDANLQRLIEYCKQDVKVERDVSFAISDRFGEVDRAMFELDAKINNRGVKIDVETAAMVNRLAKKSAKKLQDQVPELTDGALKTAGQVKQAIEWLSTQGYNASDLQAETVESWQNHSPMLTDAGQKFLALRQKTSLGSVAKFEVMVRATDPRDNRLRGLYQLYGASQTGRWGGRLVQPQNLPRMSLSDSQIEMLVSLYRSGELNTIEMLYGDAITPAKEMIRPMFTADEGKGLIVSDLSQIECRTLAWLAGCDSLLHLFASSDRDPYSEMASKIYGKPPSEYGKGTDGRQLGKVVLLGCGYGMGPDAFRATFASDFNLSFDQAKAIIQTYRSEFPEITSFWYKLEDAFRTVLSNNSMSRVVLGRLTIVRESGYIAVHLPSGRTLLYHEPRLGSDGRILFRHAKTGVNDTYGGKLVENATQAVARDVLANAMLKLDQKEYDIVGHVHDEVLIEHDNELDTDNVSQIMKDNPSWAKSLPLECETAFGKRYTK